MNAREKGQQVLDQLNAIEKYTEGFNDSDYLQPLHNRHLKKCMQQVLESMFKAMYGDGDDAVANFGKLVMAKQMGLSDDEQVPPEKIKQFIQTMMPDLKKKVQHALDQMGDDDEEEEG